MHRPGSVDRRPRWPSHQRGSARAALVLILVAVSAAAALPAVSAAQSAADSKTPGKTPGPGEDGVERPRAREVGVAVGVVPTGPLNAMTDVAGVRVGQVTVTEGDSVRTGVTAILPHGGDLYRERVPAAVVVGNGYGKLLGVTQVRELGELETPRGRPAHPVERVPTRARPAQRPDVRSVPGGGGSDRGSHLQLAVPCADQPASVKLARGASRRACEATTDPGEEDP